MVLYFVLALWVSLGHLQVDKVNSTVNEEHGSHYKLLINMKTIRDFKFYYIVALAFSQGNR